MAALFVFRRRKLTFSRGRFDPEEFGDTRPETELLQPESLYITQRGIGVVELFLVDIVGNRFHMALEHGFHQAAQLQTLLGEADPHRTTIMG